ncbi:transporter substrate-binding domain-containing protein [Alteromonas sp. C1M14]|uniref:substrate-binding periplasmic protein n=1 Tax=Alteromonas sp. C1M14 TaxID=2841567 RepID=UPI001C08E02D|nr:transporter substrate-binding domain-containing protein [Alteromonas sp. C1M14]MBU2977261.1 transporter substrate-binding domain-containing protein [Alteromonas sp. C1M14]
MTRVCSFLCLLVTVFFCTTALAQIKLGASSLATYVDNGGEPAKLNHIVEEAFTRMGEDVELQVLRRAFLGSALSAGQIDGEFAFLDLDPKKTGLLYSQPYLPLKLFVASKRPDVIDINLIPQLRDSRIAIENRFANTDQIRGIREIKWSRNPTTFDAFKQFADERAPYLMTSALLIDEFNRLLVKDNEEPVFRSAAPLITGGFYLTLTDNSADSAQLMARFNATIETMQTDGSYNRLLGLPWIIKDVDNDGVGDYVSTKQLSHLTDPALLTHAYSLDNSQPNTGSLFVIDGTKYDSWEEANDILGVTAPTMRDSLLDPEIYKKIIRQW